MGLGYGLVLVLWLGHGRRAPGWVHACLRLMRMPSVRSLLAFYALCNPLHARCTPPTGGDGVHVAAHAPPRARAASAVPAPQPARRRVRGTPRRSPAARGRPAWRGPRRLPRPGGAMPGRSEACTAAPQAAAAAAASVDRRAQLQLQRQPQPSSFLLAASAAAAAASAAAVAAAAVARQEAGGLARREAGGLARRTRPCRVTGRSRARRTYT